MILCVVTTDDTLLPSNISLLSVKVIVLTVYDCRLTAKKREYETRVFLSLFRRRLQSSYTGRRKRTSFLSRSLFFSLLSNERKKSVVDRIDAS